jgi:hypothetical protein
MNDTQHSEVLRGNAYLRDRLEQETKDKLSQDAMQLKAQHHIQEFRTADAGAWLEKSPLEGAKDAMRQSLFFLLEPYRGADDALILS